MHVDVIAWLVHRGELDTVDCVGLTCAVPCDVMACCDGVCGWVSRDLIMEQRGFNARITLWGAIDVPSVNGLKAED